MRPCLSGRWRLGGAGAGRGRASSAYVPGPQGDIRGLTVYARASQRPAFLTALLATVDELKSCCIPPEALITAGQEAGGPEGNKLRDLGLICGTYDALTANVALDPRDRLTRAAEKLKECRWAVGKDLWLDGFTDFTPQQEEVLGQLLVQAEHMTVTLTCDHLEEDEDGTGIFSPARRTAARLIRLAQRERIGYKVECLVGDFAAKSGRSNFWRGISSVGAWRAPFPVKGPSLCFGPIPCGPRWSGCHRAF